MYKDVFKGDNPMMVALRGKPGTSRIKKVDDLEGYQNIYPLRVHVHTGASHTFTQAQADDTANDIYRFAIQAKDHYAVVNFDAKAMAMARSNIGSYLRLKAKETQETLEYVGQRMEKELWQGTSLGQVLAVPTNVTGAIYTFTMSPITKVINIQKGQKIGAWTTAVAVGVQKINSADSNVATIATVTKVNHSTGVVTATFNSDPTAGATPWAAGNYLYTEGDRTATAVLGWTSITDYIPATDPSSGESFLGTDRSAMPNYLAGWRGTEYGTVEETAQQLITKMAPFVNALDFGGSEFWCSAQVFQRLQSEAGARLVRDQSTTPVMGYTKCRLATALGDIPVMTGPYVPSTGIFLLDWSTWSLHTNRPLFHLVDEDGLEMRAKATADQFEMRWRSWSELLCEKPVANGYAPITA